MVLLSNCRVASFEFQKECVEVCAAAIERCHDMNPVLITDTKACTGVVGIVPLG
jgi:hypothetical protein